ncbi:MAG TPA: hypothetical protein VFM93_05830 [Candidatus Limnocylindria bacterium]|nr:hypothetical protein [Candidatus Limnocylindria bacterium]
MIAAATALCFAGLVLSLVGGIWDVSWHRLVGRDSFWSTPHLYLYGGVALTGLGALAGVLGPSRGADLRIGPLRADRAFAVIGLASLGVILTAPIDDLWHLRFGRDVDIWSPPHVLAVALAAGRPLGLAAAADQRWIRAVACAVLVATIVFGLNFYYFADPTREAFVYPVLVAATVPLALALAVTTIGGAWAATVAALVYTAVAAGSSAALSVTGWIPPAPPPLVLAGAVAVDLARARTSSALVIGAAFAAAFVAAEGARIVAFPFPATDLLGEPLFFQYQAGALARGWSSLWPVLAAAVGSAAAAGAWRLGLRVARWLGSPTPDQRLRSTESPSPRAISS